MFEQIPDTRKTDSSSPEPCRYCKTGCKGKFMFCEIWNLTKGEPVECGEAYKEAHYNSPYEQEKRDKEQRHLERRRLLGIRYKEAQIARDRYNSLGFFQKIRYKLKPWPLMSEEEIKEFWGKNYPERKYPDNLFSGFVCNQNQTANYRYING